VTLLGVLATGAKTRHAHVARDRAARTNSQAAMDGRGWGAAAGFTFAGLFLLASGALSYVSFAGGSPSAELLESRILAQLSRGVGVLLPYLWVGVVENMKRPGGGSDTRVENVKRRFSGRGGELEGQTAGGGAPFVQLTETLTRPTLSSGFRGTSAPARK